MSRLMKVKGKSKKKQGHQASVEEASSTNQMPEPRSYHRGLGSSYAFAVNTLMNQADEVSGSKNGFLGVEKHTIDPNEHASHSLLPKEFDPRKKR